MDNLTHTLVGVAMGRAGLSRRFGAGTTLLLAVASNIPDVDVATLGLGPLSPTYRRTLTHSVVGVPFLALGLALLWRWRRKDVPLPTWFGLAMLGAAGHVLLDLLNSYGVVVLYPFSHERFELACTFIIDLALWAILLLPILLSLLPSVRVLGRERLFQATLVAVVAYVGACAVAHHRAVVMLDHATDAAGMRPQLARVFPEPLGLHRFRGVAREGDTYLSWLFDVARRTTESRETVHTDADEPDIRAVRELPDARRLEWFFAAPVWRRVPERGEAEVYDLRFRSAVLPRGKGSFTYRFPLPPRAPPS